MTQYYEQIITPIGDLFLHRFDNNDGFALYDSEHTLFAKFEDYFRYIDSLINIKELKDLLRLSFCRDISYQPTFNTENGIDEIKIGNKKVYIVW
jgi:hypothetical protein